MRLLAAAIAMTVPLVGLLTWLSINSAGPLGNDYVFAQRDVARVSLAEAALQADVLQARAGLLRDYDPIVVAMNELGEAARELHTQAMVLPQDTNELDGIERLVARDEGAVEQFKTDNALLQNSLSSFDVLDTQLAAAAEPAAVTQKVVALGNAVFHLNRSPSADSRQLMQQQLTALSAQLAVHGDVQNGDLRLLLLHAQMLARLLPAVDNDLRSILAISTFAPRQVIRQSQDARRLAEEQRAQHFRIAFYATAMALVLILARVAAQWRSYRHNLRRRSIAEVKISAISAQLAAAPLEAFAPALGSALGQLGTLLDADRAYLLLRGVQPDFLAWSSEEGKMENDLSALRSLPLPGGKTRVLQVAQLPDGPFRDAVLAMRPTGWYGICLRLDKRRAGLFVFETCSPARSWPAIGFGLAQVAAEVLQGAILGHAAARQRAALEVRIDRSRRMEAIGTFTSGIAHNFNNVLGAIQGHAEMAAEQPALPGAALRNIIEIQRAGQRAQDLIANILSFGTRKSAQHQIVAVDTLLAEALALIRVLIPADIELVIEPSAPGARVRGDLAQLQQVLVNLAKNAAQAMQGAGRLTVSVDQQQPSQALTLSHGRVAPGRYVRLRVADTGAGMSAETLANIFRPFFTTKPAGTGLGLATIREIVQDHQGILDVRTAPGQGSVFSVWLAAIGPIDETSRTVSNVAKTILLFAPDRASVMHDEDVLAALGYEPSGFHEPARLLEEAARAPERFDAIIADCVRIDDDLVQIMMRLRRLLPTLPMVLITNDAIDLRAPIFADLGLSGVLQRPLRSGSATELLEGLIDQEFG
jgi:signal transduction histidine kinase